MIANLIIALAELRKLALLYLLIKYGWHSPEGIIGAWLSWQFASAILLGILSDKIGRKPVLYFTIFFSILVGLFATSIEYFFIALLIDGVCVATLPVTFAAKNDQHPLRDKRLTYAEASLAPTLSSSKNHFFDLYSTFVFRYRRVYEGRSQAYRSLGNCCWGHQRS